MDTDCRAGISQSSKVSNHIPTTIMRLFSLGIRRQPIKIWRFKYSVLCSDTGPNRTNWIAFQATRRI